MKPAVSLITLGVADLARGLRFYRDGLGWKTSFKDGDNVAFFQLSNVILGLWSRAELAKDAGVTDAGKSFAGMSIAHNVRTEQEVDEALDTARRAGGTVTKPAQKTFWGGYSGYFSDPDGHLWEVAHNPFWDVDDRGVTTLKNG